MRDELKPLVSMYHCCVEADGRSEDQQNASRVRKLEESNLSREDLKFEAEDSTNQKCRGSTRSQTRACLGVDHCFPRHWTETTVPTSPV